MLEQLLNQFNLYIWVKDKSSRYIYVNESYAKAAGMDAPDRMIGKTDDDVSRLDFNDAASRSNQQALNDATRLNAVEDMNAVAGMTDILASGIRFYRSRW